MAFATCLSEIERGVDVWAHRIEAMAGHVMQRRAATADVVSWTEDDITKSNSGGSFV